MSSIGRYIFKQLLSVTIAVTLGLTFAIWLSQSLRFIDFMVNRGLPPDAFLKFLLLLMPSFMMVVVPIATFCAVLFIYNKLTMDSEMVVMRAAGISQWQLARPALLLAVFVTLFVASITVYFLPASFRAFKDMQRDIRDDYSAILLQEGVFNSFGEGLTVYIRDRTSDGKLLGILVHDSRNKDKPITMMAEEGAIVESEDGPRVVMARGNRQEMERATGKLSLLNFDRYTIDINQFREVNQVRWREPKERFLHELVGPIRHPHDVNARDELISEFHYRLTLPLLTITFVMVGLAVMLSGEFNRRGQTRRLAVAVLCVVLLESAMVGFKSAASSQALISIALYLVALIPMGVAAAVLSRRHRPRGGRAEQLTSQESQAVASEGGAA